MAVLDEHAHKAVVGGNSSADPPVPDVCKRDGENESDRRVKQEAGDGPSLSPLSPKSPPFYPVKAATSPVDREHTVPIDDEEDEAAVKSTAATARLVLKFLIGTEAAGAIIGKHGATVGELESSSGVKIQLSRTHEYFPGTAKRTVALCGTVDQALVAMYLCLTKVEADGVTMLGQHLTGESTQIALIVPDNVCGSIIGRGGATLKSFMDDSGAKLVVSSNDRHGERVIYITGDKDQQVRAAALIATQMIQHPSYNPEDVPLSYPTVHDLHHDHPHEELPHDTSVLNVRHHAGDDNQDTEARTYSLPDECVGVVIGKHGATIQLIRDRTGATVKVEDSNGSGTRNVSASGSKEALAEVDSMLLQLVTAWGVQDGPVDGRSSLDGGSRRGSIDMSRRLSNASCGSRRSSMDNRHHHAHSLADKQDTWRSAGTDQAANCSSRLSLDSRDKRDSHGQHSSKEHHYGGAHGHGHGGSNTSSRRSSMEQPRWRPSRASVDSVPKGSKAEGVLQKNWPERAPVQEKIDEKKVMASSFYS